MSFTGFLENFYLYHPLRKIDVTPADHGVPFEDVRFQARDGVRLHGWYVEPPGPDRPVLLWAHGNAGNLSHRARNIAMIHTELRAGVFLFDYRGFGRSQGKPGESGLYEDARGAYACAGGSRRSGSFSSAVLSARPSWSASPRRAPRPAV